MAKDRTILEGLGESANALLDEVVVAAKDGKHPHAAELLGAIERMTYMAHNIEDHPEPIGRVTGADPQQAKEII